MHHNQWSDFFLAISGRVRTVGLLIFWPVFCLLAIWPEMSSKFWQVIPQQFKGAWFTPNGFLGAFFV